VSEFCEYLFTRVWCPSDRLAPMHKIVISSLIIIVVSLTCLGVAMDYHPNLALLLKTDVQAGRHVKRPCPDPSVVEADNVSIHSCSSTVKPPVLENIQEPFEQSKLGHRIFI